MVMIFDLRDFSNAVFYEKKSIDAISVINVLLTVTIAIDANLVVFKNVLKKECQLKVCRKFFLVYFDCKHSRFKGVRMGRIPKLIKEKALAEHNSSSVENDDPAQSSPSRVPSMNSTNPVSTSVTVDLNLPLIDEHSLFADLDSVPIDNHCKCHTNSCINSNMSFCHNYKLPDNFTIDETNQNADDDNVDNRIVTLNRTALTNYMTNCEEHFANDVTEHMKKIVTKISHPTSCTELNYEESSFIRYLRWKMFELSNQYNGRTRQLIERMNTMNRLGV